MTKGKLRLVAGKPLAGKRAKPLAHVLVGPERLVVRVLGICGNLFGNRTDLAVQRFVVLRVAQQRFDPRLVRVLRRSLLLEQQLAEQDADANVRERAKGEDAVRRADELVDLRVFSL